MCMKILASNFEVRPPKIFGQKNLDAHVSGTGVILPQPADTIGSDYGCLLLWLVC